MVQNVGQQAQMILSQPLKLDIYIQAKYLDIYIWARYLVSLLPIETPGTDALDKVKSYFWDMYICYYFHSLTVPHPYICVLIVIVVSAQIIMGAGVSSREM